MLMVRLIAALLALSLAACGNATTPSPPSILASPGQAATFTQVQQSIETLYRNHPDITTFEVKQVRYPAAARDKVLAVCRQGAEATTARARAAQDVLACAPLIYFFYSYGRQADVPEAFDAARQLYGYALTNQPVESTKPLTDLLQTWGIT